MLKVYRFDTRRAMPRYIRVIVEGTDGLVEAIQEVLQEKAQNVVSNFNIEAYQDDIELTAEYPDTNEGWEQAMDDAWDLEKFV